MISESNNLKTMTNKITTWRSAWALFAFMMFAPLQMMAQTEIDWNSVPGSTLDEVTVATADLATWEADGGLIDQGKIPDKDKTVFIYNTKLKKFINTGAKWGTAARLADNGMPCWIEDCGTRETSCGTKTIYKIHSVYKNYGTNLAGRSDNVLKDNESLSADRGIGAQGGASVDRGYKNGDNWVAIELWEWCIEKNTSATTSNQHFIYRPLWVTHPEIQDAMDGRDAVDLPANYTTYLIQSSQYTDTRYYNNGEGITNFDNYLFAMNYDPNHAAGPVCYKPVAPSVSGGVNYIAGNGAYYNMSDVDEWKFISVQDYEDIMNASLSSKGISVDVTYLINDDGFYRTSRYHTTPNTQWNYKAVNTLEQFQALTIADLPANTHDTGFDFPGGTNSNNIGGGGCDNDNWGQYYCAMMNNPGLLWQEVTVPKTGWYELSVQAAAAQAGDYLMCAKKTNLAGTLKYEPLKAANYTAFNAGWTGDPIFGDAGWQQHSGEYLFEEDPSHTSSIRIHLNANETMLIGVLKLSTADNADATRKIPYTAIDNFRLTYIDFVSFILDEDATNLDYLEQYQKETAQTCYLNRNFVAGNWNTIILPVNLTKAQFKTAFDDGTTEAKLGELASGSNGVLYFTTINIGEMADGAVVLESGKPYIIKVAKNPGTAEQQQVDEVNNTDHFAVGDVYYKFEGVTFNADSYAAARGAITEQLRPSDGEANKLHMTGSYVRRYTGDPLGGKTPRCYTLNKGAVTYYANGAQLKGFRAWITDANDPVVSGAKGLNRFATTFNFIDASQNVTYIDGVPAVINDDPEAPIYNMSGQRMPAGNLPKGIYIKGGKKYIVR